MKLPHMELAQVPEHLVRACAEIADTHNPFPEPLIQRLLSVVKEGVPDLSNVSITLIEVIQAVRDIPVLVQNTRYLNLSTWMNPEGGLVKPADLVALGRCFPQLLCVNAIGIQHFDSTLVSGWYGSDRPSFSILRYEKMCDCKSVAADLAYRRAHTAWGTASCYELLRLYKVQASHPPPFRIFIRSHSFRNGDSVLRFGQPFVPSGSSILHIIYNLLRLGCADMAVCDLEWSCIIGSTLATVDNSTIPVLMPARIVDHTLSPTGWTLVMNGPPWGENSPSSRPCMHRAFAHYASEAGEPEVMGFDDFLSSLDVGKVTDSETLRVVSDIQKIFKSMELLTRNQVKSLLALPNSQWKGAMPSMAIVCIPTSNA
ncbi:uncharacterized protein EI90DRAFT_1045805 [Cantharellus anzutake]|uniref:uncharacterized protein n=1 Tax=Cantharellus anzutake TaxID=1750568 RepID=UPI001904F514|nr:uncharacterized protein EI90DRAFT_1045805 [Cantharellus anzutake]KAF8311117.1 hypothetical protein EI90DRAFT_1045805 [Cantharellus anzutake]